MTSLLYKIHALLHPTIILSQIRIYDTWLLLFVGGMYEVLCRLYILMAIKLKPNSLLRKEYNVQQYTIQVNHLRKLGPSSFVETSKMERQLLSLEKEVNTIYENRKRTLTIVEKQLLRYGNIQLACIIFFLYYGVPIITIQGNTDLFHDVDTALYIKRVFFPISYIGTGIKLSRYGITPSTDAACSFGALAIMWSAQVMMGQIMDAVDAYYLQS